MSQSQLSRRAILRGLGATVTLPWMESLSARHTAGSSDSKPPTRMAFLFVPNGVHMPDWTPPQVGYNYDLPFILQPLREYQDELLVLSGLTHDKGRANSDGAGDHARAASAFLTGSQPRKTSAANIRVGVSVDQVAAQTIGHHTKFPSLELGCERGRGAGNCDSGYSCAYSSNISWSSETTPVGKEIHPRLVFERLFANRVAREVDQNQTIRETLHKSILDFVREDATRLHHRLARSDQRKLDEYLTSVREIERRLHHVEQISAASSGLKFNLKMPQDIPSAYDQHIQLMCDMLVLAFQADLTRIATFMLANAGSNRSYRPIGVPDGHHNLSHHGGDPKKHAKIRLINRFHVQQLAYLLGRLQSVQEGDGTLLDNCMIVYGSGLSDGNRHNNENLPVLLAGRGGGTVSTGRHVMFEQETPMTNLFLSMLDRMGTPIDYLGDSTGRLSNLE